MRASRQTSAAFKFSFPSTIATECNVIAGGVPDAARRELEYRRALDVGEPFEHLPEHFLVAATGERGLFLQHSLEKKGNDS